MKAAAHGSRSALAVTDGPALTYADLVATVDRLVSMLADFGIDRSSRLAVVLPNGIHVAVGLLAASSAAISVPLAPQATADEYRVWLQSGRISHMLTSSAASPAARDMAIRLGLPVLDLAHGAEGYRVTGTGTVPARGTAVAPASPGDVAVVLMTSGSTGTPKRVPLTHAHLLTGAMSVARSLELGGSDRVLVMWEQYHVGGIVDLLLAPLAGGGTAICADGFDALRFFALLDRVQPTWFQGVPTTLRELLVHARQAGRLPVTSTLRLLRSVAAPLTPQLMGELEAAFGVPVIQTFGMTEASPLITTNRLPPGVRKPGSTGMACDCEVAVPDAAGEPLPPGTVGEVAVRGRNVFSGYEDAPEINSSVFRNGWFMTGDLGWLDPDGFLFLTGRVKEMINRGGEKIAPAEIEEVAGLHPAVAQAAAFAIPHATLGEDVGLAIVPRSSGRIDREGIRSHIARHLSRFKLPAVVLVLDDLPRTKIGRIHRGELASLAASAQAPHRSTAHATSQPAEDPLVGSLAALWAFHLDLPSVDPDDEFEMIGGDSLSRIRLALAVESLCSVTLPESTMITTVRRMAADVHRLGGNVPLVAADTRRVIADAPTDLWGDGDASALADATPADIRRHLAGSRTIREFESHRESLLNVLTLEELAAVAERAFVPPWVSWAGRLASWSRLLVRGTERLRVAAELSDLRRAIHDAAAAAPGPGWQRERVATHAMFYRRRTRLPDSRLVVGFAGNHQRLMLPTYLILENLPKHCDLLLITDPDRRHFASGVPGIAGSIEGVCDWVAGRIAEFGHGGETIVSFGTSGGGLAAICAAYALGFRSAAVVAADSPGSHRELERFLLEQLAATPSDRRPDLVLAYDPDNRRDRAGGEAIAALIPTSRTVHLSAAGAHNALQPAAAAGRLATLLEDLLGSV